MQWIPSASNPVPSPASETTPARRASSRKAYSTARFVGAGDGSRVDRSHRPSPPEAAPDDRPEKSLGGAIQLDEEVTEGIPPQPDVAKAQVSGAGLALEGRRRPASENPAVNVSGDPEVSDAASPARRRFQRLAVGEPPERPREVDAVVHGELQWSPDPGVAFDRVVPPIRFPDLDHHQSLPPKIAHHRVDSGSDRFGEIGRRRTDDRPAIGLLRQRLLHELQAPLPPFVESAVVVARSLDVLLDKVLPGIEPSREENLERLVGLDQARTREHVRSVPAAARRFDDEATLESRGNCGELPRNVEAMGFREGDEGALVRNALVGGQVDGRDADAARREQLPARDGPAQHTLSVGNRTYSPIPAAISRSDSQKPSWSAARYRVESVLCVPVSGVANETVPGTGRGAPDGHSPAAQRAQASDGRARVDVAQQQGARHRDGVTARGAAAQTDRGCVAPFPARA